MGRRGVRRGRGGADRPMFRERHRPSRGPVDARQSARDVRVNSVLAVEVNPLPIDESLATPRRREPHRVVVVDYPIVAARNASRTGVKTNTDSLVSDVLGIVASLDRRHQAGAVIHHQPGLNMGRLGTALAAFGQLRKIVLIDGGILAGIRSLEEGLADVVNRVVFLLRHHPRLRRHLIEAVRDRAIHAQRIVAVLERTRGKS